MVYETAFIIISTSPKKILSALPATSLANINTRAPAIPKASPNILNKPIRSFKIQAAINTINMGENKRSPAGHLKITYWGLVSIRLLYKKCNSFFLLAYFYSLKI